MAAIEEINAMIVYGGTWLDKSLLSITDVIIVQLYTRRERPECCHMFAAPAGGISAD